MPYTDEKELDGHERLSPNCGIYTKQLRRLINFAHDLSGTTGEKIILVPKWSGDFVSKIFPTADFVTPRRIAIVVEVPRCDAYLTKAVKTDKFDGDDKSDN